MSTKIIVTKTLNHASCSIGDQVPMTNVTVYPEMTFESHAIFVTLTCAYVQQGYAFGHIFVSYQYLFDINTLL